MNQVATVDPRLPASVRKLMGLVTPEASNELTGGVTSGFPIISYKGKIWRIRKGGEETMHLDANQQPVPFIDVVLIKANPHPSKIFYDKQYSEGSNEAPRCYSNDGIRPDANVQNPIAQVCAGCPNNAWGSRITDQGKKSRACSDARRMAVVFADDLAHGANDCAKYLLRVPPASLNPLKDYAEKVLNPKGIPFFAVVTRISFDVMATHPQFALRAARFLTDAEADIVAELRDHADVTRILAEAQDFPAVDGTAGNVAQPSVATTATPPAAGKPSPAKPAMRAASDEEAGADLLANIQPAPAPAAAPAAAPKPRKPRAAASVPAPAPVPLQAAVESEEEDDMGGLLASTPSPAPVAAAPAPRRAAPVPAPAPAVSGGGDFDALLDTILG
jgi:hypothetical protein